MKGSCSICGCEDLPEEEIAEGVMTYPPLEVYFAKLAFSKPIINRNSDGCFSTVRRGIAYSAFDVGEKVVIDDRIQRKGTIKAIKVKRFEDLSWADLITNYEEGCFSQLDGSSYLDAKANLLKSMRRNYPDFDSKEIITWLLIEDEFKTESDLQNSLEVAEHD